MKDTLEYRILKHLKDNDNGTFIEMEGFIEDEVHLMNKLASLSKKPEKYISITTPVTLFGGGSPSKTFGTISAKIEFNGIKYLESLNEPKLTKYQKIYLPLFIIFGLSTFLFAYMNYNSNNRNDSLDLKVDSLINESHFYKDSVRILKKQIILNIEQSKNDTLSSKNVE
jgi:hypothetical protein